MKRLTAVLALCLFLTAFPVKTQAAGMEIKAKSGVLMDINTGTLLYEQDAHTKLAPASVTKVMTMLLIMEAIDEGRIGWNDTVIASEAAAAKGGSQVYLKVGESMTVEEMVKSVAVSSANDCACALAEHIAGSEAAFVDKMNQRAAELGMQDTHFVNCTGLDDDENAKEHLTCAYDIALMSRELMKNHPDIQKYTTIWMDTVRNGQFGLANTNKLIRFYPGATGLKTGFTSQAGYCLSATAQRDGLGLIAVVMGCETSQDRFAACKQLLDYGFANFAPGASRRQHRGREAGNGFPCGSGAGRGCADAHRQEPKGQRYHPNPAGAGNIRPSEQGTEAGGADRKGRGSDPGPGKYGGSGGRAPTQLGGSVCDPAAQALRRRVIFL